MTAELKTELLPDQSAVHKLHCLARDLYGDHWIRPLADDMNTEHIEKCIALAAEIRETTNKLNNLLILAMTGRMHIGVETGTMHATSGDFVQIEVTVLMSVPSP